MIEANTLPQKKLQSMFNIELDVDSSLDANNLKAEFPSIYWGSDCLHHSESSPSLFNISIIRERLWLGEEKFSDIILSVGDHKLTIEYLQIIPESPICTRQPKECFLYQYVDCMQATINSVVYGEYMPSIEVIECCLYNKILAKLLVQFGFEEVEAKPSSISLLVPQYLLKMEK